MDEKDIVKDEKEKCGKKKKPVFVVIACIVGIYIIPLIIFGICVLILQFIAFLS